MSLDMRKPDFHKCENKDADQLRGHREADQRLCFCYIASTIPLLPKYTMRQKFSNFFNPNFFHDQICARF